ncbi:uncharacterized protein LOC131431006 isoform X2 [Malaya genurostris]|uniref:uncharacterized protein LOC131431006 isoform X2 n=1 Tax=Malaya genurostris TaxID=325434 RepID=UPI0026F3FCE0|nr:uncharacterized protein LOC131431006 isoform X2 [Malaya genurostris]XP_058452368.1 uncharacterized protein LOC131431006 isoform X2 [Malaya genurostris]
MDVPPKSRYTDTSYLIFQQLKEGGLQCAFPVIYELLHPGSKFPARTDELPAGVEPLSEPGAIGKNGKKATGQYKSRDSRKSSGSGIPRKQSKIAEKRKNRRSLELKAVEEASREEEDGISVTKESLTVVDGRTTDDEKKVQVCDLSAGGSGSSDVRHVSVISSGDEQCCVVQKDIQVAVDFHHRPNSEVEPGSSSRVSGVEETNNNDVKCRSQNAEHVPQPEQCDAGESDAESVRTVTPGGVVVDGAILVKAPSVQIRRKQYLYEPPYLTGSEYSESDFTDTASSVGEFDDTVAEYARVELEKKNQHEDEQQQIINKYNSLPIQQQQQQQHHQSQHLPQSRPASSLSHVNNNTSNTTTTSSNGNHYHNYSVHHQTATANQQQNSYNNNNNSAGSNESALRLSYVTERILASILPARRRIRNGGSPGFVDEHERELIEMLEQKHEKNYRIFDLESCIASISLEKLCELCKHIDSWLGSGKEKIVVLQDREDKQRLGAAIAAYLEYQKICGSNFPQSSRNKSPGSDLSGRRTPTWLDLDIYSTQKFLESITGPLRIPSHKRYIKYFSGLLAGTIKVNASSVFLRAIIVESPPCLHYRAVTVNSEWRSFIKIFEGVRCLFTSDIYVIPITTRQFIYEIKHPLRLRGDVLIRCYQIIPNNNKLHDEKELISTVQFHTCAITQREVQFAKVELDLACDDDRFPADHKVTLCFNTTPNERSAIVVFQNPLVRIEPIIDGGDNLETINEDESNHTQGPLDGSLYATILKSPKSPTAGGIPQTLISPPAEFSNTKTILNGGSAGAGVGGGGGGVQPPVTPPPRNTNYHLYDGAKRYQNAPGTGGRGTGYGYQGKSVTGESAKNGGVNSSDNENNNNNSASGNYRAVIENGSGYDQNQNPISQRQTQVRSQADGRESVRSPLTLSMDSGISSSGPVNRRLQGSSVSPSSFPSQASPQDDRHRELDDLLSDMLMTVQGIPDVGRKASEHQHHHHHQQQQQQLQRIITHYQQQQQQQQNLSDHFVNTNTDTIKRSHSAHLPALREERTDPEEGLNSSSNNNNNNNINAKERELLMYETSSTTTTLTPPPSESGRETPLLSSAYSTIRDKRDLAGSHCLTPTERELIMNLQHHQHQQQHHQSFGYPRQARSTTGASERFTSDDDDDYRGQQQQQIPYHAREDSRPFTYGSIPLTGTPQNPPASTMLKMQSGLSSPSMVRKALGTPTTGRKSGGGTGGTGSTIGRNSEFEEMLRERREKVFSEKYTIGDQQSSPGGGGAGGVLGGDNSVVNRRGTGFDTVDNGRWITNSYTVKTVTTSGADQNGYHLPHEPLKRSNTMDGSFGRPFSNDG